jgi:hypothetical protein
MSDNGAMGRGARMLARCLAAAAAAFACAGCPSLDALECHGSGCEDGSVASEAGSPSTGIFCGSGTSCTPATQQCCLLSSGATACVPTSSCAGGSDIFCDDPSQCPGGGTCWICINAQGFQGTSCDYANDIVRNDGCDQTTAMALCHTSSECEGGTTCKPLDVPVLDAGTGGSWFQACQP